MPDIDIYQIEKRLFKNKPTDNITNAIFNFTTCNGGTVINDEEYESKENSIIIFNI